MRNNLTGSLHHRHLQLQRSKLTISRIPRSFFATFIIFSSVSRTQSVANIPAVLPPSTNICTRRSGSSFTITVNHPHILKVRGGASYIGKLWTTQPSDNLVQEGHHQLTTKNKTNMMIPEDPDQVIGGGAINEKARGVVVDTTKARSVGSVFQGSCNQAHFLHAMEGLDRYPNYLARWNDQDSEELERALEQRLNKVRQQRKATVDQRKRLEHCIETLCEDEASWRSLLDPPQSWADLRQSGILDPRTSDAIFRSKFFRPSVNHTVPSIQDVLAGRAKVELDAGHLEEIMEEEVFDVYSFPLLSDSFCGRVQAYLQRTMEELDKANDPNSIAVAGGRRVRNLDHLGLSWLNDLLFQLVVRPISRHLYQQTEMDSGDLDWRHGFLAAYSADPNIHKPRQRLVPHTDDAEVTLNVCIGDVFQGGRLQFWGLRGTDMAGKLVGDYIPQRGRALLHAGRQLHEVTEVTSGDRFALIMWTRSWSGIRSTTCPCCWLNRRTSGGQQHSICTCSPPWN